MHVSKWVSGIVCAVMVTASVAIELGGSFSQNDLSMDTFSDFGYAWVIRAIDDRPPMAMSIFEGGSLSITTTSQAATTQPMARFELTLGTPPTIGLRAVESPPFNTLPVQYHQYPIYRKFEGTTDYYNYLWVDDYLQSDVPYEYRHTGPKRNDDDRDRHSRRRWHNSR
jgi:hypothetical protein